MKEEYIMVVPTEDLLGGDNYFQGFSNNLNKFMPLVKSREKVEYKFRPDMEVDPSYKQLIPYCVFVHTDNGGEKHIFQYTRGSGGGEERLHAKKSVGVGGHVSVTEEGVEETYTQGMLRELSEEVTISTPYQMEISGFINDDSNDVGKVHFGVVHVVTVEEPKVTNGEEDLAFAGFIPVKEALTDLDKYENWSQICLKSLFEV